MLFFGSNTSFEFPIISSYFVVSKHMTLPASLKGLKVTSSKFLTSLKPLSPIHSI